MYFDEQIGNIDFYLNISRRHSHYMDTLFIKASLPSLELYG